jgi:hypothetical protein
MSKRTDTPDGTIRHFHFIITDPFFILPCIAWYSNGLHFMWLCFEFYITF